MGYRLPGHIKSVAIGDGTGRELANFGFHVDYMSDFFCAEALARGLVSIPIDSDRILVARSEGGLFVSAGTLEKAELVYDDTALY